MISVHYIMKQESFCSPWYDYSLAYQKIHTNFKQAHKSMLSRVLWIRRSQGLTRRDQKINYIDRFGLFQTGQKLEAHSERNEKNLYFFFFFGAQ